jgi:hypothetical protein
MERMWRTAGIFAAGLALGLGAAWMVVGGRDDANPASRPRAEAPRTDAHATAAPRPALQQSAMGAAAANGPAASSTLADCGDAQLLARGDARDGETQLVPRGTQGPASAVQERIVDGKEALAGGRPRDAEADFMSACRMAQAAGAPAADGQADAAYQLARLYALQLPAAGDRAGPLRERSRTLYTSALSHYRAKLGDEAEKTRFAQAGLAALGGEAQATQATAAAPKTQPARQQVAAAAAPARAEPKPAAPKAPDRKEPAQVAQVATPKAPKPEAPPQVAPTQPSFDCARARSTPEKIICADPELARRDRELGRVYAQAKAAAPDRRAFQRDSDAQWRWREQNCRDRECLRQWYDTRREQLDVSAATGDAGTSR